MLLAYKSKYRFTAVLQDVAPVTVPAIEENRGNRTQAYRGTLQEQPECWYDASPLNFVNAIAKLGCCNKTMRSKSLVSLFVG